MLRLFPALLLSFCLAVPGLAATIDTVGTFEDAFGGGASYSSFSPDPGSFFLDEYAISGLEKFDPSLGTLNSVEISASFDYEWELFIEGISITDESAPHSAEIDFFFEIIVGYTEAGLTIDTLAGEFPGGVVTCSDGPFGPPCGDSIGDFTSFFATGFVDAPFGDVELADFIGAGAGESLDTVSLDVFIPIGPEFILENLDEAGAEFIYSIFGVDGPATVTLTYDYTPVPEPGTFALLGLGLAGLAVHRRRR